MYNFYFLNKRFWFVLDILCIIPYYFGSESHGGTIETLFALRFIRVLKLNFVMDGFS